jgi:hypothetical protein
MPEISVTEDDRSRSAKDEIRVPEQSYRVLAVPEATLPHRFAQQKLWLRVFLPVRALGAGCPLAGGAQADE